MAHYHSEPYIALSGLTDTRALISWGAFFFKIKGTEVDGRFKLIEDDDLAYVIPPRKGSIGESSTDYGPAEIWIWKDGTDSASAIREIVPQEVNHVWIEGLSPNTNYRYRVFVNGKPWAEEERRDWIAEDERQGLFFNNGRYDNRFTTYPREADPTPDFAFAVIGDYGKGMKDKDSPQKKIADALETAVRTKDVRFVITTGDHIYGRGWFFFTSDSGDEDCDWFFSHYQPYRYILNQIPFYPACGNHDTDETEQSDDYTQLLDNFYIRQRFLSGSWDEGDAIVDRGLFYSFQYGRDVEFISIDSSKPGDATRAFLLDVNRAFLDNTLPPEQGPVSKWRIPFFHHPPYVDGPSKRNDVEAQEHLVPRFESGGVRLVFNGHEHNFQVALRNSIHYVLSGAGGDLRDGDLRGDPDAHNIAWAPSYHFLIVEYRGGRMYITPYGELADGQLRPLTNVTKPNGDRFPIPLEISLT